MNIITVVKNDPAGMIDTYNSVIKSVENGLFIANWIIKISCDTDCSLGGIEELPSFARVDNITDSGIYDGMNIAINTLKYYDFNDSFTMLLNSGDTLIPSKAKLLNSILSSSNEDKCIIFSATAKDGRVINPIPYAIGVGGLNFCHQAVFLRLNLLVENPFPTHFKIAGDYSQFIRMRLKNYMIVNTSIVEYSVDGVSEQSVIKTRIDNFKAGFEIFGCFELIRVIRMYFFRLLYRFFSA